MKRADILLAARRADLARSGLDTPSVVKKLRIGEPLDWTQTEELTGINSKKVKAMAYEIPYHDVAGRSLHYSRWKLIALEGDLPFKYYQEEKTIPHLYFPPVTDWQKIAASRDRVIITEGEKKAACATLHGLPAIAVGGVWSWKSKRWGMRELPDFDWLEWRDREVEICYDGDMYTNEDVHTARDALVSLLTKRGAHVYIRYLPNTAGRSALDDFLVAHGVKKYQQLQCERADLSRELALLNDRVAYVEDINSYVSVEDGTKFRTEKELQRRYGTIKITNDSGRLTPATDIWSQWPHRRTVRKITYAPGQPRIHDGCYNEWRGWGTEPRRGDVSQFLEVVQSIEGWSWLLQWLAYPIQNPGAKLNSAVVVWSVSHGTGKSFIGEVMRDIYGRGLNSSVITSADLHGNYNGWIANKQFVMGEEVSDFAGRADYNLLKSYITGESVLLKEKYVPGYDLPNRANFYFTSNHPNPVKIDRNDRRFFVGTLDVERPKTFWNQLDRWRFRQGGPAAFMWYLLNKVDLAGFEPKQKPPATTAKSEMMVDAMTALEAWCYTLVSAPNEVMEDSLGSAAAAIKNRDVFSVSQIYEWMPDEIRSRTDTSTLGRVLTNMGVVRLPQAIRADDPGGMTGVRRLVAIRNFEYWRAKIEDKASWRANYEGKMTVVPKSRGRPAVARKTTSSVKKTSSKKSNNRRSKK